MSEDGDKDKEDDAQRPSRPDNAASRRGRRGSARKGNGRNNRDQANPQGKPSGPGPGAGSSSGREGSAAKAGTIEEKQPLHQRIVRYIREVLGELRKVVWPTRKQMSTYTVVVLAFMLFMIGLVWALDLLFARVVFAIFG
ncbi:preprotein translocase subunit SecE [Haloechinothrix sp. YIM 98757]|uniref:Protein translocase subunit SecE n=1 Tax=Haloechinothrix aidingensis TaxID=2752311 RepID=A0A838A8D2_9PSEU|nr:preprotein translocase subunit SecE [Haloechinothrix aidingensis]